jgi:cobalt-zinc-cadmium efflux system protein
MHDHSHSKVNIKYLGIALVITIAFFVIELIGSFLTNSLALLTDAWHMLNDVLALTFAVIASWVARRPVSMKKTYGYYRAEILSAFLNGIFLWAIVAFIFYEAFQRIQNPVEIKSLEMLLIASFGLIANSLSAFTLSRAESQSLNVKGAFLHVIADILGSVGAIFAGLVMLFTEWYQIDSLISIIIGVLIFYSSTKLIRDSLNILLEGVPFHIDLKDLEKKLLKFEEVKSVHDLHVWCITTDKMCCMSGHVVVKENIDQKQLLARLISMLKENFGIDHTTIQLEESEYPKSSSEH